MISFPAGYDQSAFRIGGNLVRYGSVPFRDFLDTKPPVIFYLYALSTAVFGDHDAAIRIFDFLYHLIGVWLFYKLLTRHGVEERVAITSVVLYTTIYVGAGYWMTAQAETFALIPILFSVDIGLRFSSQGSRSLRRGLAVGLLGAFLFLLKYTLLTIPLGVIVWLFTRNTLAWREKLKFTIATLSGIVCGLVLYVLYLSVVGGLDTWLEAFAWLAGYSSIEPLLSPQVVIDRYLQLFQMVLVEVFTLSMIACAAIGLYRRYSMKDPDRSNSLLTLCIIQLGIGILATLYERKLFHYHYLKFLWAFAPIAAIGLVEVSRRVAASWKSANVVKRILLIGFIGIFCFYSPLLSLRQPLRWTYYRIAGTDPAEVLDTEGGNFPLKEMQSIGSKLRPILTTTDDLFFWGNHVQIYSLVGRLPATICLTNTPLSTDWTPKSWKDRMHRQLAQQRPSYVIIEKGDFYPFITGSSKDSRQRLFEEPFLSTFMQGYDSIDGTAHFDVYRRR